MRFQVKEIRQVLEKFGVLNPDSKIDQISKTNPDQFSTLFQFNHNKKHWTILFNETLDDDEAAINELAPWPTEELTILKNPESSNNFALPFRQKTCYLIVRNLTQLRLDAYLAQRYPEFSRSQLQKMIKNQAVKVNNQSETSPKRLISTEIDKISLKTANPITKKSKNIEILFENDDLIIINKPVGVLTHATTEHSDDEFTIADFAKAHGHFDQADFRAGIVHRLDRTTSGVMIIAKNATTATYLQAEFAARRIQKTYHAIVTGTPKHPKAKIDLPLKRSLKKAGKFIVDPSGKPATTNYEIIKSINDHHLVKLQPQTGRTHQLRVHMSYLNLPILGDNLYGGQKFNRIMLHASSITFTDQHGQVITVNAPLPEEFSKWTN